MTTLSAFVAVDNHGVSSLYLASDSRLTYFSPTGEIQKTDDLSQKLFTCINQPEMFGYSGVEQPTVEILKTIITKIDNQSIDLRMKSLEEKKNLISKEIERKLQGKKSPLTDMESTIVHCSQEYTDRTWKYLVTAYTYKFDKSGLSKFDCNDFQIPKVSDMIEAWGTGLGNLKNVDYQMKKTEVGSTSRGFFMTFFEAITNTKDKFTGGSPQLVGMYRKHMPKHFGIVFSDKLYLQGKPTTTREHLHGHEWRNENFEICDPMTRKRKAGAMIQPKPKI